MKRTVRILCLALLLILLLPGCGKLAVKPLMALDGDWVQDSFYQALLQGPMFDSVTALHLDYTFADGLGIARDATAQERQAYEQATGFSAPEILRCVTKQALSELLQLRLGHPLTDFEDPDWFAVGDTYYFAGGMECVHPDREIVSVIADADAQTVLVQRGWNIISTTQMDFECADGVWYPVRYRAVSSEQTEARKDAEQLALAAYRTFNPPNELRDLFGGVYLDKSGHLTILLTDMDREADVLARFEDYEPVILPCQYTKKELEQLRDTLWAQLPEDARNGCAVDERQNRVYLYCRNAAQYAPTVWDLVKGLPVVLEWGPGIIAL